jgi:hypothetical protein
MRWKKELAALRRREKKTASLRRFPAAILRAQRKRFGLIATQKGRLAAPGHQPETVRPPAGYRPACKLPMRPHSTRAIAEIRRLDDHRHCR